MLQRSQVSGVALYMSKVKVPSVSQSVSEWVSQWQGHLLSCSGQLKIPISKHPREGMIRKHLLEHQEKWERVKKNYSRSGNRQEIIFKMAAGKQTLLFIFCAIHSTLSNLRCYNCAPCLELDYYWGDPGRWEADCYLDRHCMKISGTVREAFTGLEREVNIRGCPWVSLLTRLEEGCHSTTLELSGLGAVVGEVCFCSTPLCNASSFFPTPSSFVLLIALILCASAHLLNWLEWLFIGFTHEASGERFGRSYSSKQFEEKRCMYLCET